jgi:hypothetical protein
VTAKLIKQKIEKLVRDRGHVSFVEILNSIPEAKGDLEMCLSDYPNIVLWGGVSSDLLAAIAELTFEQKVHLHPATRLTYLADGAIPDLPEARSLKQYKTRRWLPICFHHSPLVPK